MSALLEIRSLDVCYGEVKAVHGVDLSLGSGEIVTSLARTEPARRQRSCHHGCATEFGIDPAGRVELGKLDIEERVARACAGAGTTRTVRAHER